MAAKTTDFPVKQKQLNEDISKGSFQKCYLLYGEEAYLRFQNRDKLLKALDATPSSMNFNRYEGDSISPAEIIDMAETMPFLAERRVILVQDSGFFKNGCPQLAEYLKAPSDTVVFIFVEEEMDKRKDMFKAVSKIGFEMECIIQDDEVLKRWIRTKVGAEGKEISPRAQALLLDRVGTDISNIASEIEKLICYCIDRSEIKEADIEAVCANYLTSRIFAMTDAISAQNQTRAMELYYDLLALKEPAPKILALISRQFNMMLQVKEMTENRKGSKEIASALGLAPFAVTKYQNWSRSFSYGQLIKALDICASNDEAVKKGKLNMDISVEMVIIACTSMGKH